MPPKLRNIADRSPAAKIVLKFKFFLRNLSKLAEIVNTKQTSLVSLDNTRWYNLKNSNNLLFENSNVYGVKTGYTESAKECLVFAYEQGNNSFIVTILGSEDRFGDAGKIIEWLEL